MLITQKKKHALVIGAGPMGLETALRGIERGYETTVLEAGRVGEHIRQWGHIRMFSPFKMNLSPRAKEILGNAVPPDGALQTGDEFAKTVLEPLANSDLLRDRILTGQRVVAIARSGLGKLGLPNHPLRAERGFRVLAEDAEGREHIHPADLVFDASGVFGQPNWCGAAGMPALGERRLDRFIIRHPPDIGGMAEHLSGKTILLVGHGHSAANTIVSLARLLEHDRNTAVIWAVKSDRTKPVAEVPDDPLVERARIVESANRLAQSPPANLRVLRRASVEAMQPVLSSATGNVPPRIRVSLRVWKNVEEVEVDRIISLTGYRPNLDMLRETTAEFSSVTEGTRGLYKALTNITDCLARIEVNPKDLLTGEPNLFIVGVKSYGRNPGFLMQSGVDQLEGVFRLISA